jgi:hypothetical protein
MSKKVNRRSVLTAVASSWMLTGLSHRLFAAPNLPEVTAFRNPGCSCCESWAKLMEKSGFKITMSDDPDLAARRKALGVPESIAGCHLALVGRYVIEGHVPIDDVLRLLDEQPDAMGLAVPGMPAGSPGMETDGEAETYSVLIFKGDGASQVFSQH